MPHAVEFFFDIGSPYSYLAATQIDAECERAGTKAVWRPFLLGGVFKASSNNMPGAVAAKASYMLHDLFRWAQHYGVPFNFSSRFPLNTLRTERVLTAVDMSAGHDAMRRLALELFDRYWVRDQDVSADAVIADALSSVGLDAPAMLSAADAQPAKDKLRDATDEAVKRGAFGAPTFFVGEAMFFGNDRIMFALEQATR